MSILDSPWRVPVEVGIPLRINGHERRIVAISVGGVSPGECPSWTVSLDGGIHGVAGTLEGAILQAAMGTAEG